MSANDDAVAEMANDRRVIGVAGLLSAVAGAVAVVVDEMWTWPSTDATAAALLELAASNRTAVLVAMLLDIAAVTLWIR